MYHMGINICMVFEFKHKKRYTDIDNPDKNLILRLTSKIDKEKYVSLNLDEYIEYWKYIEPDEYGRYLRYVDSIDLSIDFKSLASDFAGIEFLTHGMLSIDGAPIYLDYYSKNSYGCIWNTDIIKDMILMYKFSSRKP